MPGPVKEEAIMTELSPDALTGTVQQMDKRLDSIERRLDGIETRQREDTNAVNQRIDTLTRWVVGIQLSTFIALVGLLVTILLKLP